MALQKHNNLDGLFAEAAESVPLLEWRLRLAVQRWGGIHVMLPLKTRERVDSKAKRLNFGFDKIGDYCRGAIIVPDEDPDAIRDAMSYFFAIRTKTINCISRPLPTELRAMFLNVKLENGHVAEVLITTQSMWEAYQYTHDDYKRLCEIWENGYGPFMPEEQREVDELMSRIVGAHEAAASASLRTMRFDLSPHELKALSEEREWRRAMAAAPV